MRQRKFAAAAAAGKTQTEAYKEAGYSAKGKRTRRSVNASKLAKKTEIQAQIEAMQVQ